MSSNIAIVTDSTAYLTQDEVDRYGILVVPLTVNFEERTMTDGNVDSVEFFKQVDASSKLPFTSQPSVGQFKECYEELLNQGKEIISIHISSKLSGTPQSAMNAAQMLDPGKISVVDSELVAEALAFLVRAASEWAARGADREEITSKLEKEKKKIKVNFTPDTLEYLKRGGRIGGAQALLGTLLQIKPVLTIKDGYIEALDKVRTRKKGVNRLLQELPVDKKIKVAVVYVMVKDEAEKLKEYISENYPNLEEITVRELGPVVSIHGGPRLLGLIYWPLED